MKTTIVNSIITRISYYQYAVKKHKISQEYHTTKTRGVLYDVYIYIYIYTCIFTYIVSMGIFVLVYQLGQDVGDDVEDGGLNESDG